MTPLHEALEDLARAFDGLHVDYMVMGGIAVRFWGVPRPTFDLDFTLALSQDRVAAMLRGLEARGYTVPEYHESGFLDRLAGMQKCSVTRYAGGRELKVDLFLVTTAYQKAAFSRRVRKAINDLQAWVISPEDLILHKLIAGRDRDLADIADILLLMPDVDREYLRRWAGVLGVAQQLEKKLAEAADRR